jgi:acyl carrier protein
MTEDVKLDLRQRMRAMLDEELTARARVRLKESAPLAAATPRLSEEGGVMASLAADVLRIAVAALRLPPDRLDPTENLANYGIDSIGITEVMVQISRHFGVSIAPTTFFEARRLEDLVTILHTRYRAAISAHYTAQAQPASEPESAARACEPTPASGLPDREALLARHRRA